MTKTTNLSALADDTDMKHNLISIASRLTFAPRNEELVGDSIYEAGDVMYLAVPRLGCPQSDRIKEHLVHDSFIVNNINKKRIKIGEVYVIVKPKVDTFDSGEFVRITTLLQVKSILDHGWKIAKNVGDNNAFDLLVPGDQDGLEVVVDYTRAWNELVALCINLDVERNCDWTTNGAFNECFNDLFKNESTKSDDAELHRFVQEYVDAKFDSIFNQIFTFTREKPEAFYYATVTPRGIALTRHHDVRAFAWHFEMAEKLRAKEQAREEGLG